MDDWIHCNLCYQQQQSRTAAGKDLGLQLTSCGHLVCSECRQRSDSAHCPVCNKTSSSIRLTNPLPPQIENYVLDPVTSLQKSLTAIKQAVGFQQDHRTRLKAHKLHLLQARLTQAEEAIQRAKRESTMLKRKLTVQQDKLPTAVISGSSVTRQSGIITPQQLESVRATPIRASIDVSSRQLVLQTPQSLGMRPRGSPMQY